LELVWDLEFGIWNFCPRMNLSNAILVGLKEIWAHKFRSLLTMLGIILGVSSLIGMSAIVKGMENGMKEALIALGGLDKVLMDEQSVPAHQEHRADEATGRTIQDVYALKKSAPLLKSISPEMRVRNMVITRDGKSVSPSELVGVWPVVIEMNLHKLGHGRFFSDLHEYVYTGKLDYEHKVGRDDATEKESREHSRHHACPAADHVRGPAGHAPGHRRAGAAPRPG